MEINIKQKLIKIPTYNIENFKIKGEYARGIFTIPFSITEKPIIPSVNRGRKVANLCGGIKTRILKDEMTRAPVISCKNPQIIKEYLKNNSNEIKEVIESTTSYGKLKSINTVTKNSELYIRIGMDTGNAAGHNIITKASQALLNHLIEKFPEEITFCSVSGNYCVDKKPAKINIEKGRGKSVEAKIIIPKKILIEHLKTTPEKLIELNFKKNIQGSELSGSLGKNAHHANIVGAIFLATGQDIANVVEGSLGETRVEYKDEELHFSIYMPSLIVGTVGGGTSLKYARKNLELMDCDNSKKLAELIAAATLCGELSLMAALTNKDELIKTHEQIERSI